MKNWWLLLGLMTTLLACHRPAKIVEAQGEGILIDSTFDAIQDSAISGSIIQNSAA